MGQSAYNTDFRDRAIANAGLEVYLTASESFTGAQNVWYSPSTNVALTGDFQEMFDYVGGSIVFAGTEKMKFLFTGSQTVTNPSGSALTLEFCLGKNGTPSTKTIQQTQSKTSGIPKEITCQGIFELENGDELDFFFRQTSSGGDETITLLKGLWTVIKVAV